MKPERSGEDIIHAIIKGSISSIPLGGALVAELLSQVITPAYERRLVDWIKTIAEGLNKLENKFERFSKNQLETNDLFISVFLQATQIAIRDHQKEKLKALKNAVLNSCILDSVEESKQLMFLNMVERFTDWHIMILKFLQEPREWMHKNDIKKPDWKAASQAAVLEYCFGELKNQNEFYDSIVKDLYNDSLIKTDSLHGEGGSGIMFEPKTSIFGNELLSFIISPYGDEE